MMLLRHLLAIAVLPFTVTVLVPIWIARRNDTVARVGHHPIELVLQCGGVVLLGVGLMLFASSLRRFAVEGHGTLAPWDPPRDFVVRGPYRFVRNPMISGVIIMLFAESLLLLSRPHAAWALTVLVINLVYIPLVEEPQLERRFGSAYHEYCANVRRFWPRVRPWQQRD